MGTKKNTQKIASKKEMSVTQQQTESVTQQKTEPIKEEQAAKSNERPTRRMGTLPSESRLAYRLMCQKQQTLYREGGLNRLQPRIKSTSSSLNFAAADSAADAAIKAAMEIMKKRHPNLYPK